MIFARVPDSMTIVREKMRQLSAQLKSASDILKRTARSRIQDAARAWQKTWRWPLDWWAARKASASVTVEKVWRDEPGEERPSAEAAPLDRLTAGGWPDRHPKIVKALRIAVIAIAVFLALPYLFIPIYRFVDPPFSALMLEKALLGEEINYEWVDFQEISPNLAKAAVIAEDARFCYHWGVDWNAVGDVLEDLEEGETPRGASTIPMQTAKNLFLWPGQPYLRKALEVPLAYFMTFVWPKQRVVEVYLNIAEWGPGVYGAEAAAQYHFGKSAASLSQGEAALLVAALPNPRRRNAGQPGPQTRRLASRVQARVEREAQDASCIFDD